MNRKYNTSLKPIKSMSLNGVYWGGSVLSIEHLVYVKIIEWQYPTVYSHQSEYWRFRENFQRLFVSLKLLWWILMTMNDNSTDFKRHGYTAINFGIAIIVQLHFHCTKKPTEAETQTSRQVHASQNVVTLPLNHTSRFKMRSSHGKIFSHQLSEICYSFNHEQFSK